MLKHTKEIENIINEWIEKNFYAEGLSAFMGTDFAYYYNTAKIEFSLVVSKKMNDYFLEFIQDNFDVSFNDCFLISLLHEIGHYYTIDDIDNKEYNYCQDVKATLTTDKRDCFVYFSLEDEIAATTWAVNYYLTHKKECDILMEKLSKEIQKFIILNEIEV